MGWVWVIDVDKQKVIDLLPEHIWDQYEYHELASKYKIGHLNWVREGYSDHKRDLERYKVVL